MASSAPTSNPHPSESRPDDHAWETDHPYKKPTPDDDDYNKPAWEGSCHCGRVQYTISREKPLASKYCHCTDCQRMHAVRPFPFPPHPFLSLPLYMSTNRKPTPPPPGPLPMGGHLPQIRPALPPRRAEPDFLLSHAHRACAPLTLQSVLCDVPCTHHGRRTQHGDAVPGALVGNSHRQGEGGLQVGGSHLLGREGRRGWCV